MTRRFRKKPVVIEATQWFLNGDHPEDNCDIFDYPDESGVVFTRPGEGKVVRYFRRPDVPDEVLCSECGLRFHNHGWIDTLEDGHRVCPGDWIITGVRGERYPCKPDIFAATYEEVGELTTDTHTSVRPDPEPAPPVRTTADVLASITAELVAAGVVIDPTQLAWAISEYPRRMQRALGLVRS